MEQHGRKTLLFRLLWEIAGTNRNDPSSLPEDWYLSRFAPFYEVDRYWRRPTNNIVHDFFVREQPTMERIPVQVQILREYLQPSVGTSINERIPRVQAHLRPRQLPAYTLSVMRLMSWEASITTCRIEW